MSIFTKSFRQTFQKKNWSWLGGFSGVVTVVAFLQQIVPLEWWQVVLVMLCSLAAIAILFYLFFFLRNAYSWIHDFTVNSIWGEIITVLAEVYAMIHELERKQEVTEDDIAKVLGGFCNKVKKLFDKKTNSKCCVSIKVPISNYSETGQWMNIVVKNIARDQEHISERDTQEYKDTNHDISGNTAYVHIISLVIRQSTKPNIYLDNDVHANPNYDTTSNRNTIPYKSELVVPILPIRYRKLDEVWFGGFLCIDSSKQGSFDAEHYDVPMTIGLADGLYSIMQKLLSLQDKNQ